MFLDVLGMAMHGEFQLILTLFEPFRFLSKYASVGLSNTKHGWEWANAPIGIRDRKVGSGSTESLPKGATPFPWVPSTDFRAAGD
jgi:hypothetical protein